MKTPAIITVLAVAACVLTAHLHSQAPATPKSPLEQLRLIKTQNQALLEKQTAALVKLDEIQKEAAQVRFLSKRS
jgi:hypothetical protein